MNAVVAVAGDTTSAGHAPTVATQMTAAWCLSVCLSVCLL